MIPIYKPTIKRKDMDSVLSCMVSDMIGPGAQTHELETGLSEYLGCAGALAFSSYYVAIMLAIEALDLEPGSRVIVSALSPVCYLNILEEEGFVPLILDVEPHTGIMGLKDIEEVMEQDPKAIIFHYTLGIVPEIEKIRDLGLPLVEDISHALGASRNEIKYGAFGDLAILSLNYENIITTAEGGMVLAREKKYYAKLKKIKEALQNNLFLSNLNASLGLTQLKDIGDYLARRAQIFSTYKQAVQKSRNNKTLTQDAECQPVYYSFPMLFKSGVKDAQKICRKRNIEIIPAYADSIVAFNEEVEQKCVNARALLLKTFLFPLYPMLSNKNVGEIGKVISVLP